MFMARAGWVAFGHGPGDGYLHSDDGAAAGRGPETNLSADQGGPLAHSDQTDRPGVGDFLFGDAAPVVLDLQDQPPVVLLQPDRDPGGIGVPDDIGQGFLEDAKKHGREIMIPQNLRHPAGDGGLNPGSPLKIIGLPFDGRDQSEIVQDAWAQFGRDAPDGLDGGIDVGGKALYLDAQGPAAFARELAGQPG